jgi:hypothetical protein
MPKSVLLYISAATDLGRERERLGRAVAEIPVSLGWRIVQSPTRNDPVARQAVAGADIHLLLLGGDIRAPVGLEWQMARRAGRWPVAFLKQHVLRTPAAQDFVRFVAGHQLPGLEAAAWRPFRDAADLRRQVLGLLVRHLVERAGVYALTPLELARLEEWTAELDASGAPAGNEVLRGAGESGILLSRERYVPSEGIQIQPREDVDSRSGG